MFRIAPSIRDGSRRQKTQGQQSPLQGNMARREGNFKRLKVEDGWCDFETEEVSL